MSGGAGILVRDGQEGREGIGSSPPRREDLRLLTGRGRFSADRPTGDAAHAAFVRSPHAHADIGAIDTAAARAMPGVLAVLTGADTLADGLGPMPHNTDWTAPPDAALVLPEGFEVFTTAHHPLALERVRHVGEPVALVVAESAALAADAAEMVAVDYAPLPAVSEALAAMEPGAPAVWPARPDNRALSCTVGDARATARAFETASHVVRFSGRAQRVTGHPMEPRAALGEFEADGSGDGVYLLHSASGAGVVRTRERLAATLGVPLEACHCIFGDMGGNFGTRNAFYPEYALLPWAARRVGRPVAWTASRNECFTTDYQARDLVSEAELALDGDGNFLGLRGRNVMNLGAQTVFFWPLRKGLSMMQSVYRIPAVHFEGHAVLTHTAPTAVYRSAGRPEAVYMIERLIDLAAREHGFDRVELRRRNLIPADAQPFTNGVGVTYDSGDYRAAMERALAAADWDGFPARRARSAAAGLRRGIAVANYIEVTSGFPRERAELTVATDGTVELAVGTMSSGQGHETSFPLLVAGALGLPAARVHMVANDSRRISVGGGSHSGRSMRLVSLAVADAADALLARGRAIAGSVLQADPAEISYAGGRFTAVGGGSLDLAAVSRAAREDATLAPDLRGPFVGIGEILNRTGGFPYGCHVCEVEVDPESGTVALVAWSGIDDVGRAVHPGILHGQAHGAIAQGVGQALCEAVCYDPADGQLLSGSLQDYALPRADDLPSFTTLLSEMPASSHPMGIRPGGEGGTTPALALVVNAIVDALGADGVRDVAMPATPERVWQALRHALGPAGGTAAS